MNRHLSKFLQISIPLGLGIFLIWYVYQSFTPEQISETKRYFSQANYWFVGVSVLLSILSHVIRAYRWNFMLEPLGYKTHLTNNFMAISVAYLMNIFIPKSGEVSRAVILDKYENVPFQKGFGTIISERIVDLFFLLIYTLIALTLKFEVLYGYISENIPSRKMYLLLAGVLFLLCLILLYLFLSRSKANQGIKNFLIGLKEGVFSIVKMRRKGEFILYSFLIWILYILSFYSVLQSLPDTASIPFGTVVIVFVAGSFTYAFTNSGFGTYPAAIAGTLSIFGVAATAGIAFGWIAWISNIAAVVFFGSVSLLILPFYNRRLSQKPKGFID